MMRILVLAGGLSAEREVSLQSGACVTNALNAAGHAVRQLDPRDVDVASLNTAEFDVAIPLIHGAGGEDGKVQQDLQQANIPWVGSSEAASQLTFDKIRTNSLLSQHGIDVPPSVVVTTQQSSETIAELVHQLGNSVVTKPPRQGSSIGVSIIRRQDDLSAGLELAFQYDSECLVEKFIEGREVTAAIVDGSALPTLEIIPSGWYDYDSKYEDDATRYVFEDAETSARHGELAAKSCAICGVTGIARVDMRVDHDGRPWVLEINTIPGMTSHSLVPMAAEKAGMTLAQLFESAIATALRR